MNFIKNAFLVFIISSSCVALAQSPPADVRVYNNSQCDTYVWLDLYDRDHGVQCNADCSNWVQSTNKVLVQSGGYVDFPGSNYPDGAWGLASMEGSYVSGDYDGTCGSQSGNEWCDYPSHTAVTITFLSCHVVEIN